MRPSSKLPDTPPAGAPLGPADGEAVALARTRARRRLVGAGLLLLVGVIGFPLVFDTQPRALPTDGLLLPTQRERGGAELVVRDSRANAANVANAAHAASTASVSHAIAPAASAAAAASPVIAESAVAAVDRSQPTPAPASATAVRPVAAAETTAKPPKTEAAPTPTPTSAATTAVTSAPQARPQAQVTTAVTASTTPTAAPRKPAPAEAAAAAEQRSTSTPPPAPAAPTAATESAPRYVVQVGAYTDAATLREARQRVEKLGLKTYTQVIENDDKRRTRVRVGPFPSRAQAEAVSAKLKAAGLPGAILTL